MNAQEPLTPARRRILQVIREYQARHGCPPTVREIQEACGYRSPRAVTHHLEALEKEGRIERRPHSARGLRVVEPAQRRRSRTGLPVFGRVPAGPPNPTSATRPEEVLPIDPVRSGLADRKDAFALRVHGDSMEGAGILDGDMVVVEPREPVPGDIVVALIDGESTLKRYVVRDGRPCLVSENPRYPDLLPATELTVQAVVTGLIRRF